MARHTPGAGVKLVPPSDEEIPSTANGLSSRGAPVAKSATGTTGNVGAVESAGTRTAAAVSSLLTPAPGAFGTRTVRGRDDTERQVATVSQAERVRQQQVRSLRAGGPAGTGFFDPSVNPETGLTEAVGTTPTSGRTRGSVATGGTAGGGAGAGEPTFAGEGNFRSGVLGAGLFLDTTGLSAIDKLNPRR